MSRLSPTMAERQQQFEVELRTLEREVESQTYVEYVIMVKDALELLLRSRGRSGRTVDKMHPRFGPILQQSHQAVKIMHMLGFVDRDDQHMDLVDYESHAGALQCFTDVCQRSLERDGIGGVTTLDAASTIESDDPTIVVAHLAYFYFLRLMFLTLTVDWQRLMGHLAFQVKIAMDAVDACLRKLALVQPGSPGHDMWKKTKEDTNLYLANGGDQRSQLCDEMVQAANAMAFEVRMKYSEEHVDILVYMHLKKVLILETTKGDLLTPEGVQQYMTASCSLPRDYLSEKYMDTVDKVRQKCLESLERQLTAAEISELNHVLLWQASDFLKELHPPPGGARTQRRGRSVGGGLAGHLHDLRRLLEMASASGTSSSPMDTFGGSGHVLGGISDEAVGGASSDESDGEEKKDEGEKEKPDWDKDDEDETDGDSILTIEEIDQAVRITTSVKEVESLQRSVIAMIQKKSDERARLQSECLELEAAALDAKSQDNVEIVTIMEAEKSEQASRIQHMRGEIRRLRHIARVADDRHRYLTRVQLTDLENSNVLSLLQKTLVDHKEEQPSLVEMVFPLVADFLPSDLLFKVCHRMGVDVRRRKNRQDRVAAILQFT